MNDSSLAKMLTGKICMLNHRLVHSTPITATVDTGLEAMGMGPTGTVVMASDLV